MIDVAFTRLLMRCDGHCHLARILKELSGIFTLSCLEETNTPVVEVNGGEKIAS